MDALSKDQSDWLKVIFKNNGTYGIDAKERDDNKQLTLNLVSAGILNEVDRPVNGRIFKEVGFTNRGLCHLAKDCGVKFSEITKHFPRSTARLQAEASVKRKSLASDRELDILYWATFVTYLKYDFFDERNDFRNALVIPQTEIAKMSLDIILKASEDKGMSVASLLKAIGQPPKVIQEIGENRQRFQELMKHQLEMYT